MNGSKVLGKPTVKYLAHTFSPTWKLTSPFIEKKCILCWTFPTKPGLPARIHTQSSKHGSCPILRKGKMLGRMLGIMFHRKKKTIFGTEIFSLLKSLHRKYRFGKFLGLARGRAMNGSKVLGKPTVKYLDHTFSLTWKLTSHFLKRYACCVGRSPQNQVYPPEFTPSLANMEAA